MAGHGAAVRRKILDEGVKLWPSPSARKIAEALGITHSAVLYHFNGMEGLRNAIADHAVINGNSAVIVQLIGANHAAVAQMSDADRQHHLARAR